MESEGIQPYEYIAYDYGPFSKELLDALENYERERLIEIEVTQTYDGTDKYIYSLTSKGVENFEANLEGSPDSEAIEIIRRVSSEVISRFNKMPISELIDYVYDNHPSYTKNSIYS
jgi:DNA-binding PadR family transcriptional regulator